MEITRPTAPLAQPYTHYRNVHKPHTLTAETYGSGVPASWPEACLPWRNDGQDEIVLVLVAKVDVVQPGELFDRPVTKSMKC